VSPPSDMSQNVRSRRWGADRIGALAAIKSHPVQRRIVDAVVQWSMVVSAYCAWRYARGAVDGGVAESFAHGRDLASIEQSLHSFVEPEVQDFAVASGWLIDFANWAYLNVHFWATLSALIFIFVFHRRSWGFVRNMYFVAMAISLVGYALYPTAPPRFLHELGVADSVAGMTPAAPDNAPTDPLYNPFAAVPSMHVGFSLMIACSLALLVRSRMLKLLFVAYPIVMTFVVISTGNHFWLDAVLGAAAAATSAWGANLIARARPEAWSFRRVEPGEPPPPDVLPRTAPGSAQPASNRATA
jgi:hypothetical protein